MVSTLGEVRPEHDTADDDRVLLHYQRSYHRPILDVWSACTEPSRLGQWLAACEADADGVLALTPLDGPVSGPLTVVVEHCEAPRHARVRIDGRPLEMLLGQVGAVTTVELIRRHLSAAEAALIGPRWQYLLDRLDAHLAGRTLPCWADYPELAGEYR